jgi:hypothetical protein
VADEKWYYCLTHDTVEPKSGCRSADRLGPYPDRDTAAQALELAKQRTEAQDESDRRWRDATP